ncbi:hypothetical protein JHK87_027944 [Glycine soja]|nr:hypothetical protein JHK87_027944 [Glycine soja]
MTSTIKEPSTHFPHRPCQPSPTTSPSSLSPSSLLSHPPTLLEIIDAFKDSLAHTTKPSRKDKRNKRGSKTKPSELTRSKFPSSLSKSVSESSNSSIGASEVEAGQGGDASDDEEKQSMRRFVSFIGERI